MVSRTKNGIVFQQPDYRYPKLAVEIDGEDVTSYTHATNVMRRCNDGVCSAGITLVNKHARYTNKWTGAEVVKVYHDYVDATHQVFEGRMDEGALGAGMSGLIFNVFARDYGVEALEVPVYKFWTSAVTCDTVFKALIDGYMSGYTYTGVDAFTTTMQPEWEGVPLWQCLKEIAEKCGALFYCGDHSHGWHDWQMFKSGSRTCLDEMIALKGNINRFSNKWSLLPIKNFVTVQAQSVEGLPLYRSAENLTSQSLYWKKWKSVTESNIRGNDYCQARADTFLDENDDKKYYGDFMSISLPKLLPGSQMLVIAPECEVAGYKTIRQFSLSQSGASPYTTMARFDDINQMTVTKGLINARRDLTNIQARSNPYGMKHGYLYKFWKYDSDDKQVDDSTQLDSSSSDVEVYEKLLVSSVSAGTGTAILSSHTHGSDIESVVLKVRTNYRNNEIGSCKVYVSIDNKLTYTQVNPGSKYTVSDLGSTGKIINAKIIFAPDAANTVPRFAALGLYFS